LIKYKKKRLDVDVFIDTVGLPFVTEKDFNALKNNVGFPHRFDKKLVLLKS